MDLEALLKLLVGENPLLSCYYLEPNFFHPEIGWIDLVEISTHLPDVHTVLFSLLLLILLFFCYLVDYYVVLLHLLLLLLHILMMREIDM